MNWCQIIMSRGPVANGVVRPVPVPVPNSGYSLLTTNVINCGGALPELDAS